MSGVDVADGEPAVLNACGAIGNANTGSKSVIAKARQKAKERNPALRMMGPPPK
jgi:hypothetical protein